MSMSSFTSLRSARADNLLARMSFTLSNLNPLDYLNRVKPLERVGRKFHSYRFALTEAHEKYPAVGDRKQKGPFPLSNRIVKSPSILFDEQSCRRVDPKAIDVLPKG